MNLLTRPVRGLAVLTAVGLLSLVLAACSSQAAGAASPVATDRVDLPPSYRFEPVAISVKAGATVTWTNDDHFTHSVQLLDGAMSGEPQVMAPGEATTVTFSTAGTFHYQCHLHPQNMKGTVTVVP